MDENMVRSIYLNMETKDTNDLAKIFGENDRATYSEETFEAIRRILGVRGQTLPEQKISQTIKLEQFENEKILAMLPKVSIGPSEFNIIFTNYRIIGAKTGSSYFFAVISTAALAIITISLTGVLFKLWILVIVFWVARFVGKTIQNARKHDGKSPDEILGMHSANFSWTYSENVESIKLDKRRMKLSLNLDNVKKKRTIVVAKQHSDQIRRLLVDIVPTKLEEGKA